jgi:hypothetical protein
MRFIILHNKISKIRKMVKTILIQDPIDLNDPGNWRSITLISVIYRIIFGRIAQVMMANENRLVGRGRLSMFQKGFVTSVNGCGST